MERTGLPAKISDELIPLIISTGSKLLLTFSLQAERKARAGTRIKNNTKDFIAITPDKKIKSDKTFPPIYYFYLNFFVKIINSIFAGAQLRLARS
jgi:hypothetical protein